MNFCFYSKYNGKSTIEQLRRVTFLFPPRHFILSISQRDLEKKMKLTSMYSSQSKVMDHLGHMLPHENWVKAKDWR